MRLINYVYLVNYFYGFFMTRIKHCFDDESRLSAYSIIPVHHLCSRRQKDKFPMSIIIILHEN